MKSKISFFNPGVQKQNLKQHGWIALVYLVGLLFTVPLQMVLHITNENTMPYRHVEHLFSIGFPMQLFVAFIVPIITGMFLFRYVQTKQAVDMIHSLPISRGSLYINHLLSGLVMLVIPVWVTGGAAAAVSAYPELEAITMSDVWIWTAVMTVMSVFFFCFSVFIGMLSGMSIAQGILTFIILMLPAGLFMLLNTNINFFLYGFPNHYYSGETIVKWSPIIMMGEFNHVEEIPLGHIFVYLGLAVIFALLGYVLYKFRALEMAGQAIVYEPLRPIFKYGVAFCAMLVGGIYFEQYHSTGWLIFGYVFSSLLGFLIAEMILQKTWRIWKGRTFIQYAGYAAVVIIFGLVLHFDVIGYASNVPNEDDVKGVYFGDDVHSLTRAEEEEDVFVTNQAYIENVRAFHEYVAQTKPEEVQTNQPHRFNQYAIAYKLNNGSTLVRQYQLPLESVKDQLAPIVESESYKRINYHVDVLDNKLQNIVITADGPVQKNVTITDPEEIQELQHILKYEISRLQVDDVVENNMNWGSVILELPLQADALPDEAVQLSIPWKKNFNQLEQWLEDNGYLDQARILPEDIAFMEVQRLAGGTNGMAYPDRVFREDLGSETSVQVEDKEIIEKALETSRTMGDGEYFVRFVTENDIEFYGVFTKEDVPEEIISLYNSPS